MGTKSLEITVVSATGLEDVRRMLKMKVYAVVFISNNPNMKHRTPLDKEGKTNPTWNHTVKFIIPESALQLKELHVFFELFINRSVREDLRIGQISVPVQELLDKADKPEYVQPLSYPFKNPSGNSNGFLSFSYKFGEDIVVLDGGSAAAQNVPPPSGGKKLLKNVGKFVGETAAGIGVAVAAAVVMDNI